MPDSTVKKSNPVTIGILLVLVVALVATLVYLWQSRQVAQPTTQAPVQAPAGMPGGMPSTAPAPFDPATATKVPEGKTPEEFLTAYLVACENGDWDTAFASLPLGKQQQYGSAQAFGSQLATYGIVGHDVREVSATDDQIVIAGIMETSQQGKWSYDWTFKQEGGVWYAADRGPVVMMGQ